MITYNPARVNMIVSGVPLSGYVDGTFCTIEEMSSGVVSRLGLDGEVARSTSIDKRAEITFVLMQTSLSNLALAALYDADQYTAGGFLFPLLIESLIGATLYASSQAWIRKRARVVFASSVEAREWTIEAITLTPQTIASALGPGFVAPAISAAAASVAITSTVPTMPTTPMPPDPTNGNTGSGTGFGNEPFGTFEFGQ